MTRDNDERKAISETQVVTRAAVFAGTRLGIDTAVLANMLGVTEPCIARLHRLDLLLRKGSLPFCQAMALIRLFRSLDAGGDEMAARTWLRTHDAALAARPIDLIATAEGMERVTRRLEEAGPVRGGCDDTARRADAVISPGTGLIRRR